MTIGNIILISLCNCIFKYITEDPGLTFFSTIIGIVASVLLAKYIFESEQNIKKKEEQILSQNEIELFKKNITDLVYYIDKSIVNIEKNINGNLNSVNISLELNANFLKLINLNRIFHYDINKVDLLNDLVFYLNKIDVLNDAYENDTKSFVNEYNLIHLNYIENHKEFDKIYFKLENSLINNPEIHNFYDNTFNTKSNYFYKIKEIRINLVQNRNNPKKIDRETRINYFEQILYNSKIQNFDEAKEIQILCESIIKNINEMKGVEESQKSALSKRLIELKRTKELIQLYIS